MPWPSTLSEEAHRHAAVLQVLRRIGGAGRNARAATHDGVRAKVAGGGIGNVHRPALALAVARFLAQKLRKHQVRRRALRQAVPVPAVGAGDVVVSVERLADADGNGLLTDIQMRQTGHQRARVEIVDALLEQPDGHHSLVETEQLLFSNHEGGIIRHLRGGGHAGTPESARAPLSKSHCAVDVVRLWPMTVWALASRRAAIRPPIAPRPMYPRFAIGEQPKSIFL